MTLRCASGQSRGQLPRHLTDSIRQGKRSSFVSWPDVGQMARAAGGPAQSRPLFLSTRPARSPYVWAPTALIPLAAAVTASCSLKRHGGSRPHIHPVTQPGDRGPPLRAPSGQSGLPACGSVGNYLVCPFWSRGTGLLQQRDVGSEAIEPGPGRSTVGHIPADQAEEHGPRLRVSSEPP